MANTLTGVVVRRDPQISIRRQELKLARERVSADLARDLLNGIYTIGAGLVSNPVLSGLAGYYLIEKIKDQVMANPDYNWLERTSITAGYAGLQTGIVAGIAAHGFGGVPGITSLIKAIK